MAVSQADRFRSCAAVGIHGGAATLAMPMDAFLMSSGVPQSSGQAPAPGRSERQTALFRVFVFEAEDGDIQCVKEDERSLLSLMVKASKGDVSLASFASCPRARRRIASHSSESLVAW